MAEKNAPGLSGYLEHDTIDHILLTVYDTDIGELAIHLPIRPPADGHHISARIRLEDNGLDRVALRGRAKAVALHL